MASRRESAQHDYHEPLYAQHSVAVTLDGLCSLPSRYQPIVCVVHHVVVGIDLYHRIIIDNLLSYLVRFDVYSYSCK